MLFVATPTILDSTKRARESRTLCREGCIGGKPWVVKGLMGIYETRFEFKYQQP